MVISRAMRSSIWLAVSLSTFLAACGGGGASHDGGGEGDGGSGGPPDGGTGPLLLDAGPKTIIKPGMSEYKSAFLTYDGTLSKFTFENNAISMLPYDLGERRVVDVAPGFNMMIMVDDQGYVWSEVSGTRVPVRIETDADGNVFDGNVAVSAYFSSYVAIHDDGSLWYWGADQYFLVEGDDPIEAPIRLSPEGLNFVQVEMGIAIIGRTADGQVYEWRKNNGLTPEQRVLPRGAIDIFVGQYPVAGCVIPDEEGGTAGWPYVWGSDFGFWGGNTGYAEPTSVKDLWQMDAPIVDIAANQNTIHFIDTEGRLFGIGDNVNGEIGNGEELVNHVERYPTPYAWSWAKGEAFTGAPPIEVGQGIRWKQLFKGNTFAFYVMAIDEQHNLYSWGRQKSFVLGNGYYSNQEQVYPNSLDVLTPTRVDPFTAKATSYDFALPTIDAGPDQTINAATVTLSGTGTAASLTATTPPNGIAKLGHEIASYAWTKTSGPAGATIVTPDAATTQVTGLVPGTYVFRLLITDTNTGTIADDVTITVQ